MRTTRFQSDNSIISIGTVTQNLGTIDDLDDILQKHQDKDLYFRVGINPALASTDKFRDNKIGNNSISETNKIYVDLDLRKEFEKKYSRILSDSEVRLMAELLRKKLDEHPLFKQWSHIIFSGNGLHVYYIGNYIVMDPKTYAEITRKFYEKFDREILSLTSSLAFCTTDKQNQNISRLMRIPGSYNQRKKYPRLGPVQVKILYEQDMKCDYLPSPEKYIGDLHEITEDKEWEKYSPDEKHIYNNMRSEFINYICKKTGLYLKPDGKNFGGGNNPQNKAFFLHEKVNKLIMIEESPYLPTPLNGSYHTFVSLVMQLEGLSKEDACKYVLDNCQRKAELKGLNIFKGCDIDFSEKYKFSRGVNKIDQELGKFHTGQMILLVGKAGMGKTEFSFHMAKANAMKGNKVAYLSLEMKADDLVKRSARRYANIDKLEWSDKNLSPEQKEAFTKHYRYIVGIQDLQIVSFEDETTIDVVEKYITELYNQGTDLFFIDNLGFFTGGEDEMERFAEIARRLKKLTNTHPLSIILLHHIKKTGSKDEFKPGTSNDVRGNQKLVDDADKLVQIWRNTNKALMDPLEQQTVYILIHKDREFGEFGEIEFYFRDGKYYDTYVS